MPDPPLLQPIIGAVLAMVLLVASVYDVHTRTIPNAITAGGAAAVLVARLAIDPASLAGAAGWGVAMAAGLGGLAVVVPGGLGMGDAKLGGVLGLALGPGAVVALLVGCAATSTLGVAVALRDGVAVARRLTVPLAPFLSLGAATAWGLAWGLGWP